MKFNRGRAVALASSIALLASLVACGDHVDDNMNANANAAQQSQPSVEIDRQGEQGAQPASTGNGILNHTATPAAYAPTPAEAADNQLAAQVQSTLQADPDFTAMKIDVSSDDGAVTLRGRAPDPAARSRASDIARSVPDVKSVDNQLTLG